MSSATDSVSSFASSIGRVALARTWSVAAREGAPTHLVVLLHGVGSDATSFKEIVRTLSAALPRAEFLVPDGFQPFDSGVTGRQWFSIRGVNELNRPTRVREAGGQVSRWIDVELARRGLGPDRLVVVGFSQGAILAAWLAVHRTPSPAAVVMLSGRVAEDKVTVKGVVSTPIFLAHGDDDPVIPACDVEPGARLLEAWGARVTQRVYAGLGHQVDSRELGDVVEFLQTTLAPAP